MSVFHFCSIVPKRSVILCFLSGSVELMTSTRKKMLWYVTIRLKWKTGLKANFHSGKLSVDWNGQENFSLSCELWVGTNELAVLPEQLCIIWTATRDLKQRKFYYPLNYRYGLNLQVNQKLSHVVLLILLAGDVATNPPGPAYYSASTNSASRKQVKCLVLNARSIN